MNRKAFTLIELLAVIVILAIIALIATPIILGIINDARVNSRKRSAELVYAGVEYAYTQILFKEGNGNVVDDVSLETIDKYLNVENVVDHGFDTTDTAKSELHIQTKDNVYCKVVKANRRKTFDVSCGTDATYTNTTNIMGVKTIAYDVLSIKVTKATVETVKLGYVPEGNYKPGDEYIINIGGEDRIFFVLGENENDSNKIDLIMNKNIGNCVAWSSDGSNHKDDPEEEQAITAKAYLASQTTDWEVIPHLPTITQMENLGCTNSSYSCPTWLYTSGMSGVVGYWTSSPYTGNSTGALDVNALGRYNDYSVERADVVGVRPVITISKTLLK